MHKTVFHVIGARRSLPGAVREKNAYYIPASGPKVISLFSGAMGLDLGLEMAGFQVAGCLELDKWACATIALNRPALPVVQDDIRNWGGKSLLKKFGVADEQVSLVVGGPPCPSFSTAGKRQSFNDPRGQVMSDFLRIVEEIRPPFFVMENVRGILSAALRHRPLKKRTREYGELAPDERPGGVLRMLNEQFKRMGYVVTVELVNAANYGTPQHRERVVFLGSRDGLQVTMPFGPYGPVENLFQRPWLTLRDAIGDLDDRSPEYQPFSEGRLKYLRMLKEGQNWRNLPKAVLRDAMGGAFDADGGKVGFYRRLSFGKPSPTVPTSPVQKSTCLCHPSELRPLSVREYARIQQFPDSWQFAGSISKKYMQIGNAVPVGLGFVIGKTVLKCLQDYSEI